MRVIAGTARSLPLKTPEGMDTRPTTDRIKETLFNMLQTYIPDCVFVDIFSGSGGIGIEALSRGARKAYFIENFNMIDDYKENMDILLKMGMIESENGIDKYQEDLQQIKISAFGYYMKNVICKDFSYLELIASDLTFLDKQVSNQIIKYSNDEYDLLVDGQNRDISDHEKNYLRYKRLKVRISKTKKLISYFEEQELLELKKYEFSKDTLIIKKIKEQIEEQIVHKILPSAKKNFNIKEEEDTTKNGIARL